MLGQSAPFVLVITGSVGVGKSSVGDEVFEILRKRSLPIALINLDELGYIGVSSKNDPHHTQLRFKNLESVWKNDHAAGAVGAIIPYIVEGKHGLEQFTKAIPGATLYVIRLDAPLETIKDRIRSRPMGGSVEWHINRAQELIETFKKNHIEDITIDTDGKTIAEVADEVIKSWPFLQTTQQGLQ